MADVADSVRRGHDASSIQRRWKRKKFRRGEGFLLNQEKNVRLDKDGVEDSNSNPADVKIHLRRREKWSLDLFRVRRERHGKDRTGVTVATINNSRNSGGSVATSFCLFYPFLSDQWTMMMMTRETEGPSGRSDHDQMTWWSKWPRPLFNPIRTRVFSWMPSRLVWKKRFHSRFISLKERFLSKFW